MELQIAFTTLLRRAPGLRLVETPRWKPTYVRGLESLARPAVSADGPHWLRYVALGDSYTIGTSVEPPERFPDQLTASLRPWGPGLRLVANLGVNGYTTADLIRDELPALGALEPGFATLLIGVNDVVRGVQPATYETNLATILDALVARLPADRIVTVAIPDYTVTPAGPTMATPVRSARPSWRTT